MSSFTDEHGFGGDTCFQFVRSCAALAAIASIAVTKPGVH
jgi:hypothetical protein